MVLQCLSDHAGDDACRVADDKLGLLLGDVDERGDGDHMREDNTVRFHRANEPELVRRTEQVTVFDRRNNLHASTADRANC